MNNRYLFENIEKDLKEKMVFIGGPRQVGKTTFSFQFLKEGHENHPAYLNWDFIPFKEGLLKGELPLNQPIVILDEIHKYKEWRNLVKGLYDINKKNVKFLVTGSAPLDVFRRGGDSLQGRYHYWRLHPFSLPELGLKDSSHVESLFKFGGFPEPLFKAEEIFWKRWQRERIARVIQDDVQTLEHVKDLSQIALLCKILPERVGSLLSLNSLREDLSVSFETVDRWVTILENLYFCYRIPPFQQNILKGIKKEKKLFLYDWSLCDDPGIRFENMVASHLLKYCHYIEDSQGDEMGLFFLRDKEKRELDFIVVKNDKIIFAVECKLSDHPLSSHISYFAQKFPEIPCFYQVHLGRKNYEAKSHRAKVLHFSIFCEELGLV